MEEARLPALRGLLSPPRSQVLRKSDTCWLGSCCLSDCPAHKACVYLDRTDRVRMKPWASEPDTQGSRRDSAFT